MRAGRLRLTLYLGAFVVAFVAGGLVLGFLAIRPSSPGEPQLAAKHIVGDLAGMLRSSSDLDDELRDLSRAGIQVSLYDGDARLIASNVTPPIPLAARDPWTIAHDLDGGKLRGRVHIKPPLRRMVFVPLGIMLAMLILLVLVIARHLGGPLQKIERAARRFGDGDLSARAKVRRSDELGEVARAFDDMADRVTALMTAQRELMANVSHELHTPLARIQVTLDLLIDGVEDEPAVLLPNVSRELAELQRLIDDVMTISRLDLARARADGVHPPARKEALSIVPVLDEAVQRFRAGHPDRRVDVEVASGIPAVAIDPVLIRRVLENLLENAHKYSETVQPIRVTAASSAAAVEIEVVDLGIGIEPSDLARVFTPFFRTDRSRSRATGGFGLGLAFARRVVEAHGGVIEIASVPNTGTTVTFCIPISAQRAR